MINKILLRTGLGFIFAFLIFYLAPEDLKDVSPLVKIIVGFLIGLTGGTIGIKVADILDKFDKKL